MSKGGVCGGVSIDLAAGSLYPRLKLFREFTARARAGRWPKRCCSLRC